VFPIKKVKPTNIIGGFLGKSKRHMAIHPIIGRRSQTGTVDGNVREIERGSERRGKKPTSTNAEGTKIVVNRSQSVFGTKRSRATLQGDMTGGQRRDFLSKKGGKLALSVTTGGRGGVEKDEFSAGSTVTP